MSLAKLTVICRTIGEALVAVQVIPAMLWVSYALPVRSGPGLRRLQRTLNKSLSRKSMNGATAGCLYSAGLRLRKA